MTSPQTSNSLEEQIAQVRQRMADVRARVPKHDIPAALVAELDDLDEKLESLQAQARGDLDTRIAELEMRLADARARLPKHTIPASLIAEMDEIDTELEHLRSLRATQA